MKQNSNDIFFTLRIDSIAFSALFQTTLRTYTTKYQYNINGVLSAFFSNLYLFVKLQYRLQCIELSFTKFNLYNLFLSNHTQIQFLYNNILLNFMIISMKSNVASNTCIYIKRNVFFLTYTVPLESIKTVPSKCLHPLRFFLLVSFSKPFWLCW